VLLLAMMPIGDTLFATPTVEAIRDCYPAARITALVHSPTAKLMRNVPGVDEVLILPTGVDWQGSGALLRTLRELRAKRFDSSLDFTSPAYKWINIAAGIPRQGYMKFDRLWWCVPSDHSRWRAEHAARHYYDCARELALPPWDEVHHALRVRLPREARAQARKYLFQHGARPGGQPIVAIHPGGAGLDGVKRWPAERFAEVADSLSERWCAHILLLGGPDEADLTRIVAARMRTEPLIVAGDLSLLASFALIEVCDLYIGNDSGLLHAAAALGTPYVGIYGPTNPINFHPIPSWKGQGLVVLPPISCFQPYHFVGGDLIWKRPCCQGVCKALALIPPEHVIAEADELLERRRATVGLGHSLSVR
jgi:ADP-heptose:LPS heptosyltransferase